MPSALCSQRPGGSHRFSGALFFATLLLLSGWPLAPAASGWIRAASADQTSAYAQAAPEAPEAPQPAPVIPDSLVVRIKQAARMIAALRESLAEAEQRGDLKDMPGVPSGEELQAVIEDFGGVISNLSRELKDLDFDIGDQRIMVKDHDGGQIEIEIPKDLGSQVSKEIKSITSAILKQIPDTVTFSPGPGRMLILPRHEVAPAARRVIGGDAVKIGDDVLVAANEEIRGNVVTLFGDALIAGRVDGDLVTIFGHTELEAGAEVTGQIFTLGRLDREEGASVQGKVVVAKVPRLPHGFGGLGDLLGTSWLLLLVRQVEFVIVVLLVILILALLPHQRLMLIQETLAKHAAHCFAYGVVVGTLGHLTLVLAIAVLTLTVILIPLALLLVLAYIALGLVALASVARLVGSWACQRLHQHPSADWVTVLWGLVVLHALSLAGSLIGLWPPLAPFARGLTILGIAVKVLAFCFGIGALAASRFGAPQPVPPTAAFARD